jgi:hypothetical protein
MLWEHRAVRSPEWQRSGSGSPGGREDDHTSDYRSRSNVGIGSRVTPAAAAALSH